MLRFGSAPTIRALKICRTPVGDYSGYAALAVREQLMEFMFRTDRLDPRRVVYRGLLIRLLEPKANRS